MSDSTSPPSSPGSASSIGRLDRLRGLIAYHDMFWGNLAWGSDPEIARRAAPWIASEWAPWITRWNQWNQVDRTGAMLAPGAMEEVAGGLSALRERANALGVPIPDIGSSRLGFFGTGPGEDRTVAFSSGDMGEPDPGAIERDRQVATRVVRERVQQGSPWDGTPRAIAFVRWGGRDYVTPFDDPARADAYFAKANEIGIDYDYGAIFNVSDPANIFLAWERLGSPRQAAATTSGELMSGLIGRRFGGGGHHGGGRRRGHGGFRRNFGGGGGWYGWWPYGWPYGYGYVPSYYDGYDREYDDDQDDVLSSGEGRHRRHAPSGQEEGSFDPSSEDAANAFFSNPTPDPRVTPGNELFALLPVLAPGARGLSCKMDVGPDMQLHVSICVDDRCYQGSADLSSVLGQIAQGVASAHGISDGYDPGQGPPPGWQGQDPEMDPGRDPSQASAPQASAARDVAKQADAAVKSAGLMLVGQLYDRHVQTMSAGWFDSLGSGILSVYRKASSPVTWLNKNIAKGLLKFKGPVTIAATAVATAYGGPAAGAAAAKLVGPILESSAKTGGDPTRLFEDVKRQSGGDPQVVKALVDAQQAIAQTTAAYHLTDTAAKAVSGDQQSAGKIAELEAAAQGGDQSAVHGMMVIAQAFNAMSGNDAKKQPILSRDDLQGILNDPSDPPPPPSSSYADPMPPESPTADSTADSTTASGADGLGGVGRRRQSREAMTSLRREGQAAAQVMRDERGDRVIGFAKFSDANTTPSVGQSGSAIVQQDTTIVLPFNSSDEADDWLGKVPSADILYAAYFDADDPTWPNPLNEKFGRQTLASRQAPTQSGAIGILPWLAFGAAGGGAYAWWRHHQAQKAAAEQAAKLAATAASAVSGCDW